MSNGERYNLSGAVFTALTDVECEIDGLLSYDRAVIKMPAQALHQIHSELINSSIALNHNPSGKADTAAVASWFNTLCCIYFAVIGRLGTGSCVTVPIYRYV